MTPALLDLARRAVACRGWRWLPGMHSSNGWRVLRVEPEGVWFVRDDHLLVERVPPTEIEDIPDLADPATLGAVEHGLLPEGWALAMEPGHGWGVIAGGVEWVVRPNGANPMSKAAALVAALEAL